MSGNCVIYARCSTQYQVDKSTITQISECQSFAKAKNLKVKGVYKDEAMTGRKRKGRIGLKHALDSLKKGDVLLIYSVSRVSRSMEDMVSITTKIKQKEAILMSATENLTDETMGRLITGLATVLAEFESEQLGKRVKDAMKRRKQELGTANGRAKYGWKYINHKEEDKVVRVELVPVEEEQQTIAKIKEMRNTPYLNPKFKNGKEKLTPYQVIADYLNENLDKYPTRRKTKNEKGEKRKWHPSTIKKILDSASNKTIEGKAAIQVVKNQGIILTKDRDCRILPTTNISTLPKIDGISFKKKTEGHLFVCTSVDKIYPSLTDWLKFKSYADIEEDGIFLNRNANMDEVILQISSLTESDYTITALE